MPRRSAQSVHLRAPSSPETLYKTRDEAGFQVLKASVDRLSGAPPPPLALPPAATQCERSVSPAWAQFACESSLSRDRAQLQLRLGSVNACDVPEDAIRSSRIGGPNCNRWPTIRTRMRARRGSSRGPFGPATSRWARRFTNWATATLQSDFQADFKKWPKSRHQHWGSS